MTKKIAKLASLVLISSFSMNAMAHLQEGEGACYISYTRHDKNRARCFDRQTESTCKDWKSHYMNKHPSRTIRKSFEENHTCNYKKLKK